MDAESRLDYLEGRVEEQSRNWERLFADVGRVDQKIDLTASALSVRIDALSARIDRLDEKIEYVGRDLDGKINTVDLKLDRRFDTLQLELAKQFRWTIGVMVTLTVGVITAVLTR